LEPFTENSPDIFSPPLTEEDFRKIFYRFNRPIYAFFVNRGFSREEARDLMQETFLQAFRSLNRFRGESSFDTWLWAITKNVWRLTLRRHNRVKHSGREVSLEEVTERGRLPSADGHGGPAAEGDEPLDRCLDKERARLLRAAVADLPEHMRNCLLLRLVQGLKYEEIATVLQVSIGTVKSQLSDARARLRGRLAALLGEAEN
jgi:RNA polymerase sigma-70 factor, ECF subfamily